MFEGVDEGNLVPGRTQLRSPIPSKPSLTATPWCIDGDRAARSQAPDKVC
ncbi:hypothetical protein EMIT0158MI4_10382 [Burkholderia ambifaria]